MLSTLKAIFEGRKDLFEGTAISTLEYDWPVFPVIHFDMTRAVGESVESVKKGLNALVMSAANTLNIDLDQDVDPALTFDSFWRVVQAQNKRVVVLVDEYDVPLQGFLQDRGHAH